MVVVCSTNWSLLELIIVSRLKVKLKSMVHLVNHAWKISLVLGFYWRELWSSCMTAPFSVPTLRPHTMGRFLRRKLLLDIFSEGHLGVYQVPYASWCLFGYCLLRNKYLMTCVLPLIIQRKETVWRFQVEAHVAYTCKQILGLCQVMGFAKVDACIFKK